MKVKIINKDLNYDEIEVYDIDSFPFEKLDKKKKIIVHKKKGLESYCQTFGTYDIESTTIDCEKPFGFMYHWQMCVGGFTVFGRTWEEWKIFLDKLVENLEVTPEQRLVIYIHNAGYEMQFCKDFLYEWYGDLKVFAAQSRKPIYFVAGNGIEFRCSYKLTNMSLIKATENELGVIHIKDKEQGFDYKKIRLPNYEMDDLEKSYCASDVVSLYEMIDCRLKNEHDNLESIPLTSTGYVRRECRKACRESPRYRDYFLSSEMNEEVYTLLKEAGRGGNTHANRHVSNRLIELGECESIDSFDEVSAYPYAMLTKKYPSGHFINYGDLDDMQEFEELINTKACLFRLYLTEVRVKEETPMPYIPTAKLLREGDNLIADNGRVIYCDYIALTVTDIDWKIIDKEYTYKSMSVSDMHIAEYEYLPECLRKKILYYFDLKTELKDKIKDCEKRLDNGEDCSEELANYDYLYAKSKNRLNGIFGMAYTDPVRELHIYDPTAVDPRDKWKSETPDITESLKKFYKSRNSFLVYAVGVWVTCHARLHLEKLIDITSTGDAYTIYCDTDSSKACNVDLSLIREANERIMKECEELGAYSDCNGKRYYLGIYEKENKESLLAFKTMGAKKYCYVDKKGLHLTVSGVNKELGAKELGTIENFKKDFIFHEAGGQTLYYNESHIHELTLNGCTFTTASNIGMVDSSYMLGMADDYKNLLEEYFND